MRYYIYSILAILFWASTVGISRSISEKIGPSLCGGLVYTLAGIILLMFRVFRKKKLLLNLEMNKIVLNGSLFILYGITLFFALNWAKNGNQVLQIGLINYLWPTFIIFFSAIILQKKYNILVYPISIFSFFGIFIIMIHDFNSPIKSFTENIISNPYAFIFGLSAALIWALYSVLSNKFKNDSYVDFYLLATGITFFIIFLFSKKNHINFSNTFTEIILLSLFTSFGYILWDISIKKGNLDFSAFFANLTPAFSTLISCIYLDIQPNNYLWIGLLVILFTSMINWFLTKNQ